MRDEEDCVHREALAAVLHMLLGQLVGRVLLEVASASVAGHTVRLSAEVVVLSSSFVPYRSLRVPSLPVAATVVAGMDVDGRSSVATVV